MVVHVLCNAVQPEPQPEFLYYRGGCTNWDALLSAHLGVYDQIQDSVSGQATYEECLRRCRAETGLRLNGQTVPCNFFKVTAGPTGGSRSSGCGRYYIQDLPSTAEETYSCPTTATNCCREQQPSDWLGRPWGRNWGDQYLGRPGTARDWHTYVLSLPGE